MSNLTFSIIKPGAVERKDASKINVCIENAGFRIVAQRMVHLSKQQAEKFYEVHKERSFFGELVDYMSSGPVVVQVLMGDNNAVASYRDLMGATNPAEAASGTIRAQFGASVGHNAVHGSDSEENALREIAFFFSAIEIFN